MCQRFLDNNTDRSEKQQAPVNQSEKNVQYINILPPPATSNAAQGTKSARQSRYAASNKSDQIAFDDEDEDDVSEIEREDVEAAALVREARKKSERQTRKKSKYSSSQKRKSEPTIAQQKQDADDAY